MDSDKQRCEVSSFKDKCKALWDVKIKETRLKYIRFGFAINAGKHSQCKMGLPSTASTFVTLLNVHLICRSLFGHSTFFVASLVFMKGTSLCVIRKK